MQIFQANLKDVPCLTTMNIKLRQDEQIDNIMSDKQVHDRMKGFLKGDYTAYLFKNFKIVYGYALVDATKTPPYLRQFYIEREYRSQGHGKTAFDLLVKELNCEALDLEVLTWNKRGIRFWKKVGFESRCLVMRYKPNKIKTTAERMQAKASA